MMKDHVGEAESEGRLQPGKPSAAEAPRIKRVIDPRQLEELFRGEILQRMNLDIQSPSVEDLPKVIPIQRTIQDLCDHIQKSLVWGVFGPNGKLLRLTEVRDVERLTEDDAPAFQQLFLKGLREEPSSFGTTYEKQVEKTPDEIREFIRSRFMYGAKFSYLTIDGSPTEKLMGVVQLRREDEDARSHIGYSGTLYVHPSQRKRNIARTLMNHVLNQARSMGIEQIRGVVTESNKFAIEFYESLGGKRGEVQYDAVRIDGIPYNWVSMVINLEEDSPQSSR